MHSRTGPTQHAQIFRHITTRVLCLLIAVAATITNVSRRTSVSRITSIANTVKSSSVSFPKSFLGVAKAAYNTLHSSMFAFMVGNCLHTERLNATSEMDANGSPDPVKIRAISTTCLISSPPTNVENRSSAFIRVIALAAFWTTDSEEGRPIFRPGSVIDPRRPLIDGLREMDPLRPMDPLREARFSIEPPMAPTGPVGLPGGLGEPSRDPLRELLRDMDGDLTGGSDVSLLSDPERPRPPVKLPDLDMLRLMRLSTLLLEHTGRSPLSARSLECITMLTICFVSALVSIQSATSSGDTCCNRWAAGGVSRDGVWGAGEEGAVR